MSQSRRPSEGKLPIAFPKPTAQVEPYVEALGLEDTLKFIGAFGGTEIYIASDPKSRSRVVEVVGYPKARMLASIIEKLPRRVPLAKQWRAQVYHAMGYSKAEVARKLSIHEDTVRRYLTRQSTKTHDNNQLNLF